MQGPAARLRANGGVHSLLHLCRISDVRKTVKSKYRWPRDGQADEK